jgi:monoterpene epsilon-lactone hydrolase
MKATPFGMKTHMNIRLNGSVRRLISGVAISLWIVMRTADAQPGPSDSSHATAGEVGRPNADPSGTISVAGETIPFSNFASAQAHKAFIAKLSAPQPAAGSDLPALRRFYGKYNDALAEVMKARYAVTIKATTLNGVRAEIVTPAAGVAAGNRNRVLINLHGGAFMWGEGSGGEVEAIPIASVGRIQVITVAYRQGPENVFPAASQDVAAVYKELLKHYESHNIGIYGCSSGGILAAESVAWFQKAGLPTPGAIGSFCGSASEFSGDSLHLTPPITGDPAGVPLTDSGLVLSLPYFHGASAQDPLVFPVNSPTVLAHFPPTLLLAGSRDFSVSSLFYTQEQLVKAGVTAELHVWDGLWHAFLVDPDLPESQEAYDVIVNFFRHHLGKQRPE